MLWPAAVNEQNLCLAVLLTTLALMLQLRHNKNDHTLGADKASVCAQQKHYVLLSSCRCNIILCFSYQNVKISTPIQSSNGAPEQSVRYVVRNLRLTSRHGKTEEREWSCLNSAEPTSSFLSPVK